jgi:hypothetical protein
MFLRHDDPDERSRGTSASGLAKLGIGLIVAGGLLLGFGAIGDELVGRPAFAAVLLPIAGVVCLIVAYVSYARGLRTPQTRPKDEHSDSERSGSS